MSNREKKIIIVDDDLLIVDLYKKGLFFAGFQVISANNGKEGYKKILAQRPDLIITDIVMPWYDGFYLIEKVKKDKNVSAIPLIAFSNLDSQEDKKEAMELGADLFLLKTTMTPSDLVKKIEEILK
ncbi:response regulator [Candidatus Parcubacteria bacterium]|nr:response regulator [Patescibacteria group bacterium]MBU4309848.1 response regulator [Patescibacteria group bacterium]MBU4431741.1 response regulator [Patescibacteria group bacterium]MBU4578187.1 response regulator [Patescibacteria group bacterium]MCG2696723.1 response regulator [Candidatus Parcubacteria bacterium]